MVRLPPRLTPEEAVGLMLRTEPVVDGALSAFLAALRARAPARAAARKRPAQRAGDHQK